LSNLTFIFLPCHCTFPGKRSEEEVVQIRPNFWQERREELGEEIFEDFQADARRIAHPDVGDWEHGFSSGSLVSCHPLRMYLATIATTYFWTKQNKHLTFTCFICQAMARLLLGLSHAVEDEKICAFHQAGQQCTNDCLTCSVEEQRKRELEDFPVLDP
jgi:hypothetical protein